MNITPGKETSEYRTTQITLIVNTTISLLVIYGLITAEASSLWSTLLLSLVSLALPLFTTLAVKSYNQGRTDIKLASIMESLTPGASAVRPEASETLYSGDGDVLGTVSCPRNIFQPKE